MLCECVYTYIYSGILFSYEKKNLATCKNMNEFEGILLKTETDITEWYHLYVEYKKVILKETETRMVATKGWGSRGDGEM